MRTNERRANLRICAVFVGTPAVLWTIWLARTKPEGPGCADESSSPARDALMADWLAGAGPIMATGALFVLAGIVRVGSRRARVRDQEWRLDTPTGWIATILSVYSVACAVDTDIFIVASISWVVVFVFWPVTVPALALSTGLWVRRRPAGVRTLAATQALGWWSLLFGVVGVGIFIAMPDTAPLCMS